jgi:hypothetical protein
VWEKTLRRLLLGEKTTCRFPGFSLLMVEFEALGTFALAFGPIFPGTELAAVLPAAGARASIRADGTERKAAPMAKSQAAILEIVGVDIHLSSR